MQTVQQFQNEKITKIVVIDAQYFSKKDIRKLHAGGTKVYSYLNIGSIEISGHIINIRASGNRGL